MNNSDWILTRLSSLGVTKVFGVPGGACSGLDDALYRSSDIEFVGCQHESMAGYMAMGYSLATGSPGVITVTSGPGILNALAPVASARLDEISLLVLAGDVISSNAARGSLQDGGTAGLSILNASSTLAKLSLRAEHAYQIPVLLDRCLESVTAEIKGSAVLQIPMDLQGKPALTDGFSRISPPEQVTSTSDSADSVLHKACHAIVSAEKPLLMFGIGAKRQLEQDQAIRLAEAIGAPVITDAEGLGLIPPDHPLYVGCFGVGDTGRTGTFTREYQADLLVAVGCRFDDTTTGGFAEQLSDPDLLQLDYNAERIGRAFAPTLGILAPISQSSQSLIQLMPEIPLAQKQKIENLLSTVKQIPTATVPASTVTPIDARTFIRNLGDQLRSHNDSDWVVTCDIGNHLLATLGYLSVDHPQKFHFSMGLGGMGSGIGMGMGIASTGKSRTLAICGDGGTLMSGNDIYTCVKYGFNVVLIILNDGELGMVKHGTTQVFGECDGFQLPGFSILQWADSLGAKSLRYNEIDDLQNILNWQGPGPLVVDVPIDSEVKYYNPREKLAAFPLKEPALLEGT